MKKIIKLFLAIMLVVSSVPWSVMPASAEELAFDQLKTGVARIAVYSNRVEGDFGLQGFGTGFFIDSTTLITAAHVVQAEVMNENEASPYIAISIEDDTYEDHGIGGFGKVIAVDQSHDLAVVKVLPMPFDLPELRSNFAEHHTFSFAQEMPSVLDAIRIIGFPDITQGELSVTSGILSSEDFGGESNVFFSDVQASFGNSGGPAIDENNQVIGLVSQIATSQTNNSQLTRIVSLQDRLGWIEEQRQKTAGIYDIPVDFYNFMKELNDGVILDAPFTAKQVVGSDYYPEFSYDLTAGKRAGRFGASARTYIIQDQNKETETAITTIPLAHSPDVGQLEGVVLNLLEMTIDRPTLQDAPFIAGLQGIQFETNESSAINYVYAHNHSVILIQGDITTPEVQSLEFSSFQPSFNDRVFDNEMYQLHIETPEGFLLKGGAGEDVFVYHKSSVDNYIGKFEMTLGSYESRVAELEESFIANPITEEYVVRDHTETSINGVGRNWRAEIYFSEPQISLEIAILEDINRPDRYGTLTISSFNPQATFPVFDVILPTIRFSSLRNVSTTNVKNLLQEQDALDGINSLVADTTIPDPTPSTPSPVIPPSSPDDAREDLLGFILLQVEQRGEAWYINPQTKRRQYMRDGKAAFDLMRKLGLGITNADLNQFIIGTSADDSNTCNTFRSSLKGRVLLQVEENGEAWYIYPKNCRRYSLGRPDEAYEIMRTLGLGATDADITIIGEEAL